jgi:hypothetical protein
MSTTSRHVRFAEANTYYSPVASIASGSPNLPSPTFSITSLSSDEGPLTPPSYTSPLPGTMLMVHPALTCIAHHSPTNHYNVLDKLPTARLVINKRQPSAQDSQSLLAEPATNPPVSSLKLVSNHLPFLVTVTPTMHTSSPYPAHASLSPSRSRLSPGQFVTVGDVVSSLYHTLRLPISKPEFEKLSTSKRAEVTASWQARYRRLDAGEREVEKQQGVKRVDLLSGQTRFLGLLPPKQGDMWIIQFA